MTIVRLPAMLVVCLLILAFSHKTSASILVTAELTNSQTGTVPPGMLTTSTGDPRPTSFGTAVPAGIAFESAPAPDASLLRSPTTACKRMNPTARLRPRVRVLPA